MNRRQFFARTVGIVAAATVGPDAIRQLPAPAPVESFTLSEYTGAYAGIERASFTFWKAQTPDVLAAKLEEVRARSLRSLNADLLCDGRGEYVTFTGADDTPDDPDY